MSETEFNFFLPTKVTQASAFQTEVKTSLFLITDLICEKEKRKGKKPQQNK